LVGNPTPRPVVHAKCLALPSEFESLGEGKISLAKDLLLNTLRLLSATFLFALSACVSTPDIVGSQALTVAEFDALPPPSAVDAQAQVRPYFVGPLDTLTVSVFGVEEMRDLEIQVDASGRISIPLAGEIDAAGLSTADVARVVEGRLRGRYIRSPQVSVNLKETVSQVVAVDGQVNEPGVYPLVGRMTLMSAVARAKGVSELAKLDDVVVFRTVNGQRMAGLYNLKSIRRGLYEDPEVYANDVVIVGESRARRLFATLMQVTPLLTTPLIVYMQTQ
jgi:polysaccharide export outer membrane protein